MDTVTRFQDGAPGLVSVVIPVFNAEKYIEATLASVFGQSYPNIEIVVVDDGSQDRSLEILQRYSDRLTIVRQKNRGVAAARNLGVREATGEWIAFLDADDIWRSDKIELQLAACEGFAWSHTDSIFLGGINNGRRDCELTPKGAGMIFERLVCSNFVGTSSVMIRRDCFLDFDGFNESLNSIEDWDLWIRVSCKHAIGYLEEPLVKYRIHTASTSRRTRKTLPNHLKVIDNVFAKNASTDSVQHLKSVAKASSYGICSQIAEEEGDYSFALRCALSACAYEPRGKDRWERAAKSLAKYVISMLGYKASFCLWFFSDFAEAAIW